MLEVVEHGIYQRFDLKIGSSLSYEVQINEEGVVLLGDPTYIDEAIEVSALILLGNIPNLACFEYK